MRSLSLFLAALLLSAGVCTAQSRVWVEPFTEVNESQPADWINRALHQSLLDELAGSGAHVLDSATKPSSADYVVSGKIQRIDGELRITGSITDQSGKTVGGFKATGHQRELFAIEDSVAQQVTQSINADAKVAVATAPAQPAPAAAAPRIEAPFAPIRFGYEGSELQDAVRRDRAIEPRPIIRYEQPIYPQYTQPVDYGYGGWYGPYRNYGWGLGWGYSNWPGVIIVNPGHDKHHGHGGGTWVSTGVPADNGQAIRAVSGYGGRTPPPGVIHTLGGTPGLPASPPPAGVVNTAGHSAAPGVVHTRGR